MIAKQSSGNIIQSFKILKGNTRVSVLFEPMWGIPFVLYNFYLSLYMKSQGITDQQIGLLISIGFVTGTCFSLFSGIITDALGRKRTTLIFDLISWPIALAIYFFAHNFWMFALAQIVNSSVRIVAVSWNLMVIEDADNEQRVAAFNLLNIITIATGIITPVSGIVVKLMGIPNAERIFLAIAIISMTIMILGRNHFYTETHIGKQIREQHSRKHILDQFKKGLYRDTFALLKTNTELILVLCIIVLFNIYMLIGSYSSLYFAPYMTEVLGIEKASISILGGVNSGIMLLVFLFVIPIISRFNLLKNMIAGFIIMALATLLFTVIPLGSLTIAIINMMIFAVGFSISRPFIDVTLANATKGTERAGIYSLNNTIISIFGAISGFASGFLYKLNPRLLYYISFGILLVCMSLIMVLIRKRNIMNDKIA
ncbi:MAG: major facilitator superfamily 1 [Herbinix sp.]|jgi:MFS family permease|nr:major facilitator superfamily 1 [Herbinix sp.]